MAKVQRTGSKIAWSIKTQSAFGTPLVKADLTRFLKLADPVVIDDNAEMWSDRGMISLGHEWETQNGVLKRLVKLEIPVQPMPIDFAAYLIGLFTSISVPVNNTGSYTHTSKFSPLATTPNALVTSIAIHEDATDQLIQDVCCTSITIKGDGPNRVEVGATLIGSKLATALDTYTWPTAAAALYVNAFAGAYTRATVSKINELRSFELTMSNDINLDLAYMMVATEAARPFPQVWRYGPNRSIALKVSLLSESGDLAIFRAAQLAGTEVATVISCVGLAIGSSGEYDTLTITLPKGIYRSVEHGFQNGLLVCDLSMDARYDSDASSPITLACTTVDAAYLTPAS